MITTMKAVLLRYLLKSPALPDNVTSVCLPAAGSRAQRHHGCVVRVALHAVATIMSVLIALALLARSTHAQTPLVLLGVDHTPIVVADLEKAEDDFRAMGFAIKPGRFHADGIRNAHVKFRDGTELELITAPAPTDRLTAEYYAKEKRGDGPVYFGLWASNTASLAVRIAALGAPVEKDGDLLTFPAADPLHPLFFGLGEKSPTDREEHFVHANSAVRLSGFWVRGNPQERDLLTGLGVPLRRIPACGPLGKADVAAMPRGDVFFVRGQPEDGAVIGARVEVRRLDVAEATMKKNGLHPQTYPSCHSLWLRPSAAHGIWLEFVQSR